MGGSERLLNKTVLRPIECTGAIGNFIDGYGVVVVQEATDKTFFGGPWRAGL